MAGFSNSLSQAVINHFFRNVSQTPPAAIYLGIAVADPTDVTATALTNEISAGWYARQLIQFEAPSSAVDVDTGNTNTVTFAAVTGGAVTATHWMLFDAITNGNLLASGAFTTAKVFSVDDVPKLVPNDLMLTLV